MAPLLSVQVLDYGGEFEDFDLGRVVGSVVTSADDYVTASKRVAVSAVVPALKFKFDLNALPLLRADLVLGPSLWVALYGLCLYT